VVEIEKEREVLVEVLEGVFWSVGCGIGGFRSGPGGCVRSGWEENREPGTRVGTWFRYLASLGIRGEGFVVIGEGVGYCLFFGGWSWVDRVE
jgi:hypothetical protein